jgi:hypothetical protein
MRTMLHDLLMPVYRGWPWYRGGSSVGADPSSGSRDEHGRKFFMKYLIPPIAVPVLILIVVVVLAVFRR